MYCDICKQELVKRLKICELCLTKYTDKLDLPRFIEIVPVHECNYGDDYFKRLINKRLRSN